MKNTKLAFSVYALTLVLMTNAAMAAGGSANPSCSGNTFKVAYNYGDCSAAGGYASGTAPTAGTQTATWGGNFTAPSANTTCLGYTQNAWTSSALKINLTPGQTYTNSSSTWSSTPAANGSSSYTITAKYDATHSAIALDTTGADRSVIPTQIHRYGIELNLCDDQSDQLCGEAMTPSEYGLIDYSGYQLPVKYGYVFNGFFQNQTRANEVSANGFGSQYTNDHCKDGSGFTAAEAAKGSSSGYVTGCAWINGEGYLTNSNLGIAAAKLGTTKLYAAYRPKTFTVTFDKGGYSGPQGGGAYNNVPHNDSISGIPESVTCQWGTGNCDLSAPTTSNTLYHFAGYKVTITGRSSFGDKEDKITLYEVNEGYDLSNIITKDMWSSNGNYDLFVTLTAQWEPDYTTLRLFASKDADSPFKELKIMMHATPEFYDDDVKVTSLDVANLLSGKMPANSQFRGFVVKLNDATNSNLATVSVDTSALPYAKVEDSTKIFAITNTAGAFNDNNALKTALGDAEKYDSAERPYVDAYAVYAQECVAASEYQKNHVTSCKLGVTGYGTVSYAVTCDTGYNIGGSQSVNQ